MCFDIYPHLPHLFSDPFTHQYIRVSLSPLALCCVQNDERFVWDVDAYGMRMTGTGSSDNRPRRLSIEHRSAVIRRSSAAGLGPRAVAELADTVAVSAAVPQIQIVCVPLVSARGACLGVLQARRYTDSDSNDAGSGPFVAHEELVLAMSCVFISSGT